MVVVLYRPDMATTVYATLLTTAYSGPLLRIRRQLVGVKSMCAKAFGVLFVLRTAYCVLAAVLKAACGCSAYCVLRIARPGGLCPRLPVDVLRTPHPYWLLRIEV